MMALIPVDIIRTCVFCEKKAAHAFTDPVSSFVSPLCDEHLVDCYDGAADALTPPPRMVRNPADPDGALIPMPEGA